MMGALLAPIAPPLAAQTVDVVSGHVRSLGGAPVRDATVRASGRDRAVTAVQTDSAGAFTLRFSAGSGPYVVGVTWLKSLN